MNSDGRFPLLLVCFFVSGFAALIYQTAWIRQFAFVFGTSELAVATVLAAYLGGLGAGAAVAARLGPRIRRPVLAYGLLELGIAAGALAVPFALAGATSLYVALFGGTALLSGSGGLSRALFYLAASFVILIVPTGLMGATLPLLTRHAVRSDREIGPRTGLLYAVNTAGAVVGTVVAGFALIPALGLARTIHVAIAANALVFAAAAGLARRAPPLPPSSAAVGKALSSGPGAWILPLMLLSGAASFTYEVLWTRLLGQLIGGSVYAFATMLGSFLTGIALGSWAASRFATDPQRSVRGFVGAQLGTAGLSLAAFHMLDVLPDLAGAIGTSGGARLASDVAVAMATLLPSTLCIGATFPLAVRILARSDVAAGSASARVYAWNTGGAILGAVGAGFFLMPALGYAGTLTLAVAVNLGLALTACVLAPVPRRTAVGLAIVGLCLLVVLRPGTPDRLLRASPFGGEPAVGETEYFAVGRSATVLLLDRGDAWTLYANGLQESLIHARGARAAQHAITTAWLGAAASLARPEARSALIVGLGGGVVVEAVPPLIREIDVVELEPEIVAANRRIAARRRVDPLSDPRVRLILNDARGALLLSERRYDVIASQPSHPWTAGASQLYTREFFALVRDHLAPGGVFAQWMMTGYVDEQLLRAMVATLRDVLPHVAVLRPAQSGLVFLASDRPLALLENAPRAIEGATDAYRAIGVPTREDVALALVLDEEGSEAFATGAPLVTDDQNLLAMRGPALLRRGGPPFDLDALLAPHDPLARPSAGLDRVYLVQRLLFAGFRERAARVAHATQDPAARHTASSLLLAANGNSEAALRSLERAVEIAPTARSARLLLGRLRGFDLDALAVGLTDTDRAVIDASVLASQGAWDRVGVLDPVLARMDPRNPIYADSVRLRIRWRLETGDAVRAREALGLVDAMLPTVGHITDRLLRARAAALLGETHAVVASLYEVLAAAQKSPQWIAAVRGALEILTGIDADSDFAPQRVILRERFLGMLAPRR